MLSSLQIQELSEFGEVVTSVNLTSQNFTFNLLDTSSYPNSPAPHGPCENCSLLGYVLPSSLPLSSDNKVWVMNSTLNNKAFMEVMVSILSLSLFFLFLFFILLFFLIFDFHEIWQFGAPQTTLTFARNTSTFSANTLKLAVQIRDWPFRNLRNSLSIIFASAQTSLSVSEDLHCQELSSQQDENQNLKWFTINVNGVTLYLSSLHSCILIWEFFFLFLFLLTHFTVWTISRFCNYWWKYSINKFYTEFNWLFCYSKTPSFLEQCWY